MTKLITDQSQDGPSAGVTLITSILSLAMDRPVLPDLAMTGMCSMSSFRTHTTCWDLFDIRGLCIQQVK